MGYGHAGHLGICFQESFGTAYTDSFHWIPILSENLTETKPILRGGMRARYEEGDPYEGPNEIAGEIVCEGHPIWLGALLKAWCGTGSMTSTLTNSHYDHVVMPAQDDFDSYAATPPMTIEIYRDAGSAHQYYDCCADALNLEIAHGAIVKTTLSVIGGKFTKAAKSTPSYPTGSEYTWDQASVSVGGSAIDEYSTLTIAGANALAGRGTLDGTKTWNRIKRDGHRTIELTGTLLFENDDEFDAARSLTHQRVVITVTGQEVSSGYYGVFEVDIPSMRYSEFTPSIAGPGLIEASFTGVANYHSDSGTIAKFTLTNTQAAY